MKPSKIETLRRTELFQDLDENVLRELASQAIEKRLERNEILFLAGDEARGLYVVAEGSVRAFRTASDGREQVIHVERAVTTIAEVPVFDDGNYPSTVAAEEPATVYFLDKTEVLSLCLRYPQIALAATRLLGKRLRSCAELVETLSLREVGQRIARFLQEEAQSNGVQTSKGIRFDLRLTHNQLAARVGTVREVVTRALLRLQNQGLIAIEGKQVLIPDADVLADYSETEAAKRKI